MKSRLQSVTDVVTLLTCLAIVGFITHTYFSRAGSPSSPQSYKAGDTISDVKGVRFDTAERTLVMAITEGCHFCQESMPFYQALVSAASERRSSGRLRIVAVTTDPREAATANLRDRNVVIDDVVSLDPDSVRTFRVAGTPTLLLVNRRGVVESVWVGKLDEAREREVLAKIVGTAS